MKSKTKNIKPSFGFSLIEVMVASIIITSASVTLFPLQVSLLNSAEDALTRQYALFALENQLEKFVNYSKSSGDKGDNFSRIEDGSRSALKGVNINWQVTALFVNQLTIEQGTTAMKNEIVAKRVVITAEWHNKKDKLQAIQLQTVIAKQRK